MEYSVILTNDRLMLLGEEHLITSSIIDVEFDQINHGSWPFLTSETSMILTMEVDNQILELLYMLRAKGELRSTVTRYDSGKFVETLDLVGPFITSIEPELPFQNNSLRVKVYVIFHKAVREE